MKRPLTMNGEHLWRCPVECSCGALWEVRVKGDFSLRLLCGHDGEPCYDATPIYEEHYVCSGIECAEHLERGRQAAAIGKRIDAIRNSSAACPCGSISTMTSRCRCRTGGTNYTRCEAVEYDKELDYYAILDKERCYWAHIAFIFDGVFDQSEATARRMYSRRNVQIPLKICR